MTRERFLRWSKWVLRGAVAAALVFLAIALSRARFESPEPTLLLRDRAGRFLAELPAAGEERLGFWAVSEIPERVVAATLAVEDRRFRHHPGVDPLAIGRALRQNLASGKRISGASTLAMQVARMQRPGRRTLLRKAVEATTALFLTARYGRDGILRQYLRLVPYGNRIHGIAYAARRYLDKPVADLSWAEVAFLAAIPQAPARMNPFDPRGRARAVRRGREILDRLATDGTISVLEHQVASSQILALHVPPRESRPEEALHAVLHFAELVDRRQKDLAALPILDTNLDLDLQRAVEELAWQTVDEATDRGAGNAAALVVERGSWEVVAAVSSTGYFQSERAGAIDYLRVPRSSGSTLKPFLFALALERGELTPDAILDDLGPGAGGIQNSDERFLGPLLPRVALANSRNVPAANLLADLGLDEGYAFLGEVGLHHWEEPARRYGLGLAIGGLPVTLEQLVRAYTTLACDGRAQDLVWYRGQEVGSGRQVLSEESARLITLFLSDPQARLPTFPRMGFSEYPFAVAVKTGTSSRYRDAWTVAWSERYLVGVWVGRPDSRPMSRLSGFRAAARLAQRILERLHADQLDGLEGLGFPPPRGWHAERLCGLTGRLATSACDPVFKEWFPPGSEPLDSCAAHRLLPVDRRSGRLASATTPAAEIEARTFIELPPRYAAWAMAAGLPAPPAPVGLAVERRGVSAIAEAASHALVGFGPPPAIEISSPEPGLRIFRDPEVPRQRSTLALKAVVNPQVPQLVWYVDGQPFETVDPPFVSHWPLATGAHTFQARVPWSDARSALVQVEVE